MNYEDLRKNELIDLLESRDNEISRLQNKVYKLENEVDELDTELEALEINKGIKDTNNFIFKLKVDNLYTEKLEDFINNYLKYYNG